jgi:hypothetical protein
MHRKGTICWSLAILGLILVSSFPSFLITYQNDKFRGQSNILTANILPSPAQIHQIDGIISNSTNFVGNTNENHTLQLPEDMAIKSMNLNISRINQTCQIFPSNISENQGLWQISSDSMNLSGIFLNQTDDSNITPNNFSLNFEADQGWNRDSCFAPPNFTESFQDIGNWQINRTQSVSEFDYNLTHVQTGAVGGNFLMNRSMMSEVKILGIPSTTHVWSELSHQFNFTGTEQVNRGWLNFTYAFEVMNVNDTANISVYWDYLNGSRIKIDNWSDGITYSPSPVLRSKQFDPEIITTLCPGPGEYNLTFRFDHWMDSNLQSHAARIWLDDITFWINYTALEIQNETTLSIQYPIAWDKNIIDNATYNVSFFPGAFPLSHDSSKIQVFVFLGQNLWNLGPMNSFLGEMWHNFTFSIPSNSFPLSNFTFGIELRFNSDMRWMESEKWTCIFDNFRIQANTIIPAVEISLNPMVFATDKINQINYSSEWNVKSGQNFGILSIYANDADSFWIPTANAITIQITSDTSYSGEITLEGQLIFEGISWRDYIINRTAMITTYFQSYLNAQFSTISVANINWTAFFDCRKELFEFIKGDVANGLEYAAKKDVRWAAILYSYYLYFQNLDETPFSTLETFFEASFDSENINNYANYMPNRILQLKEQQINRTTTSLLNLIQQLQQQYTSNKPPSIRIEDIARYSERIRDQIKAMQFNLSSQIYLPTTNKGMWFAFSNLHSVIPLVELNLLNRESEGELPVLWLVLEDDSTLNGLSPGLPLIFWEGNSGPHRLENWSMSTDSFYQLSLIHMLRMTMQNLQTAQNFIERLKNTIINPPTLPLEIGNGSIFIQNGLVSSNDAQILEDVAGKKLELTIKNQNLEPLPVTITPGTLIQVQFWIPEIEDSRLNPGPRHCFFGPDGIKNSGNLLQIPWFQWDTLWLMAANSNNRSLGQSMALPLIEISFQNESTRLLKTQYIYAGRTIAELAPSNGFTESKFENIIPLNQTINCVRVGENYSYSTSLIQWKIGWLAPLHIQIPLLWFPGANSPHFHLPIIDIFNSTTCFTNTVEINYQETPTRLSILSPPINSPLTANGLSEVSVKWEDLKYSHFRENPVISLEFRFLVSGYYSKPEALWSISPVITLSFIPLPSLDNNFPAVPIMILIIIALGAVVIVASIRNFHRYDVYLPHPEHSNPIRLTE